MLLFPHSSGTAVWHRPLRWDGDPREQAAATQAPALLCLLGTLLGLGLRW